MSDAPPGKSPNIAVSERTQQIAWAAVLALAVWHEVTRWLDPQARDAALTGWFSDPKANWTPFIGWLLLAPLFWRMTRRWGPQNAASSSIDSQETAETSWRTVVVTWLASAVVAIAGLVASLQVGSRFGDLPPAYHDEYSYLFQAETFLAGRTWFPSFEPRPELFDQMLVLNEGRFASRYFPGVGAYLAPFVALGDPWLGYAIAHAVVAWLVFWIGRECVSSVAGSSNFRSSLAVGLIAGLLTAVSPGLTLFSNLLLGHHPTLLGLMLFGLAFLRMRRTGRSRWTLIAGCGLTYAMLCRPMTAAGIGLPFGIWFAWMLIAGRGPHATVPPVPTATRGRHLAAMTVPLLVGFVLLFFYNRSITGDGFTTPYGLYTRIYTPRHVYGFNNRVRGERQLGPKVLENYDEWTENLTPSLAARNVGVRTESSLRWTLGVVPLTLAGVWLTGLLSRHARERSVFDAGAVGLIAAAIVSLHLVHIPYWFEGMMGWHYVMESAPLWLMLFAVASVELWRQWRSSGRVGMRWWWAGLIAIAVCVNWATIAPLWPGRIPVGIAEVRYPRQQYAEFRNSIEQLRDGEPAIVFVKPDPTDRHMDYVTNPPSLDRPVLVARLPDESEPADFVALFPDRRAFQFDAATGEIGPVDQ